MQLFRLADGAWIRFLDAQQKLLLSSRCCQCAQVADCAPRTLIAVPLPAPRLKQLQNLRCCWLTCAALKQSTSQDLTALISVPLPALDWYRAFAIAAEPGFAAVKQLYESKPTAWILPALGLEQCLRCCWLASLCRGKEAYESRPQYVDIDEELPFLSAFKTEYRSDHVQTNADASMDHKHMHML